jgi:hypothetical protein
MHRGQQKRARQQFGDQSADRITNEHRVKPGPHKHCLIKQLKNNVHGLPLITSQIMHVIELLLKWIPRIIPYKKRLSDNHDNQPINAIR